MSFPTQVNFYLICLSDDLGSKQINIKTHQLKNYLAFFDVVISVEQANMPMKLVTCFASDVSI